MVGREDGNDGDGGSRRRRRREEEGGRPGRGRWSWTGRDRRGRGRRGSGGSGGSGGGGGGARLGGPGSDGSWRWIRRGRRWMATMVKEEEGGKRGGNTSERGSWGLRRRMEAMATGSHRSRRRKDGGEEDSGEVRPRRPSWVGGDGPSDRGPSDGWLGQRREIDTGKGTIAEAGLSATEAERGAMMGGA